MADERSEKRKRKGGESVLTTFNIAVGCFGTLGVLLTAVATVWTILQPQQVITVIQQAAGVPTTTPMVITVIAPTQPLLPTYTVSPTYTVPPTNTLIPTPTNTPQPSATPMPTATPQPSVTPTPGVTLPFKDTFDLRPAAGWESITGTWRVADGTYRADEYNAMTLIGDQGWTNYAVDVDVLSEGNSQVRIIVRAQQGSYMALETNCCDTEWVLTAGGSSRTIAHSDQGGCCDSPYWQTVHIRVEVKDDIYTAYSDGVSLLQVQDGTLTSGRVGLAFITSRALTIAFDNFQIVGLP